MAKPLSEEEIQILRDAFDAYDSDKGGNITVEEFATVMKASGQNPTEAEVQQIIKEVDLDGDGTINFEEFIAMMTGTSRAPGGDDELDSEIDFKNAWKEFDPSLHGSITASQFRQLMAGLGERVSDDEVAELINSVDGEDRITYKEFIQFARNRSFDDIVDGYRAE